MYTYENIIEGIMPKKKIEQSDDNKKKLIAESKPKNVFDRRIRKRRKCVKFMNLSNHIKNAESRGTLTCL